MNAGLGFHRRYGVEGILDAITFLRNGEDPRVGHRIEWIARLLRAHAMLQPEKVKNIDADQQHPGYEKRPFED